MAAAIYKFFGEPIVADPADQLNMNYKCNHCGKNSKARLGTPSNLKNHLQRPDHKVVREAYEKLDAEYSLTHTRNGNAKRGRLFSIVSQCSQLPDISSVLKEED